MQFNFGFKAKLFLIGLFFVGFAKLYLGLAPEANIPLRDYNDILRSRAGNKIKWKREGNGAIVIRGRKVHIHTSKALSADVIGIQDFTFIAGEETRQPIREIAASLLGVREGSLVSYTKDTGPIDLEIVKVCAGSSRSFLPFFTCDPLPADKITSDLRGCTSFADERCQEAAEKYARKGEAGTPYLAEYCLLTNQSACRGLIEFLISSTAASDRVAGFKNDSISELLSFANIDQNEFVQMAAKSKSNYFQEWAAKQTANLAPAEKPGIARRKQVEASLPKFEVDPNPFSLFFQRADSFDPKRLNEAIVSRFDANGYNLLMIAAIGDGLFLLANYSKNSSLINLQNSRGETVLHFLAEKNAWAEMRNLILDGHGGVNLAPKDKSGRTPLDWAKERGFERIVDLLTKAGAGQPL